MIVVADTSPLSYLIHIECDSLLPAIYGEILVPAAVIRELGHAKAPDRVRSWQAHPPSWIAVVAMTAALDKGLAYLDPGEREAIQLAQESQAELLLIDERKGRLEARRRGLSTTGTLGVLFSAGELGLIEPEHAYRRLIAETSFRTSAALEARFLRK